MRYLIEKIRDRNRLLIFEILFIGLAVFLLLLLSERRSVREVSAFLEKGAETGALTAEETESETEEQSERLTPAELAMLEDGEKDAEADRTDGSGDKDSGAKTSGETVPILLVKMQQLPRNFRIPMAVPAEESTAWGQEETAAAEENGTSTKLWTVTQEPEETAEESMAHGKEKTATAEESMAHGKEETAATEESTAQGKEETALVQPQEDGDEEYRIVEHRDGLSFRQWRIASEIYKIVRVGEDRPLGLLKKMVENRLDGYDGDWSVYVKNLKTDEDFVVNDRPMKSASVMKLFILGTVYKAIEAGELDRTDEVVSLLNSMITASDNEASNRLLYLLGNSSYRDGIAKVDAFIQEYGFSNMTVEYNGFNNSETVLDSEHNNQVSAKDCGKLLEDIYRRTWLNRSAANEIEQMMLNQQTRYKIPAGLPDGVSCGNKTGEMDTTENDAAVVYGEDCDYILVVLSSDWGSKDQAISRIASISKMVYEFLN